MAERSQSEARLRVRCVTRRVLLAVIAALYVAAVPWYRDVDAPLQLVWGLPDWVAVALACYTSVAVLNAIAWRLTDIVDTDVDDKSSESSG